MLPSLELFKISLSLLLYIPPPHAVDRTYDRTKSLFNIINPLAYDPLMLVKTSSLTTKRGKQSREEEREEKVAKA
jgi:hypothetical protein